MGLLTDRTPGAKLFRALLVAFILSIPLFATFLLIYDRQSQSQTAQRSISEGWGGPQILQGPILAIPYRETVTRSVQVGDRTELRDAYVERELLVAPDMHRLTTDLRPEIRRRAIYETIVFEALMKGNAVFRLPGDLQRLGIDRGALMLERAELRFPVSHASGLTGAPPSVSVAGAEADLQPGAGGSGARDQGFHALVNGLGRGRGTIDVQYRYRLRGTGSLAVAPRAGDLEWNVASTWPHPSFGGAFLPQQRRIGESGFAASYRVGNLATGTALAEVGTGQPSQAGVAHISLMQPLDIYAHVSRAVKYGFLFIGFTFLTFLLFDIIGGVAVSTVEYLLVGAGLVLFFVLLLAFAEVIGFGLAYLVAAAAIAGLNTAYSASVLGNWRRALVVGGLLAALYAVLYILLGLEAFALLVGSLLLLAALAATMYLTRRVDWSGRRAAP